MLGGECVPGAAHTRETAAATGSVEHVSLFPQTGPSRRFFGKSLDSPCASGPYF